MLLRTTDDLGRPFHLHRRSLARLLSRAPILGSIGRSISSGHLLLLVASLSLIGVIGALFRIEGPVGMYLLTLSPVVIPLLGAFASLVIAGGMLWTRVKQSAAFAALADKHCPACDYNLVGGLASPARRSAPADALLTCPECGAAWRVQRIGADRPEQPDVIVVRDFQGATLSMPHAPPDTTSFPPQITE